jgi:hypothetical protein
MRRLYLFPHRNYVAPDSRFRTAKQFVNDLQLIAAAKLPRVPVASPICVPVHQQVASFARKAC